LDGRRGPEKASPDHIHEHVVIVAEEIDVHIRHRLGNQHGQEDRCRPPSVLIELQKRPAFEIPGDAACLRPSVFIERILEPGVQGLRVAPFPLVVLRRKRASILPRIEVISGNVDVEASLKPDARAALLRRLGDL
jgi:hypothetical protein